MPCAGADPVSMIPTQRMQEILNRFAFIEAKMNAMSGSGTDPAEIAQMGRDYAGLLPVVATIRDWQQAEADLAAARDMLGDPDMRGLAEDETWKTNRRLSGSSHPKRASTSVSADETGSKSRS